MSPRSTIHTAVRSNPTVSRWQRAALGTLLLVGGLVYLAGQARASEIFKGADLALGEKMIAEHQCTQCHVSKVGGNGSAIYKPQGKINTAGLLRGMVEMCNTTMNLGMFPEEVTAVSAVLNRDHYKFK